MVVLGYDPGIVRELVQITTASGVEFVPRIVVEKIEVLGNVEHKFRVLCHTLPPTATIDGLLGLDFFRGKRLILDLREGIVGLE